MRFPDGELYAKSLIESTVKQLHDKIVNKHFLEKKANLIHKDQLLKCVSFEYSTNNCSQFNSIE